MDSRNIWRVAVGYFTIRVHKKIILIVDFRIPDNHIDKNVNLTCAPALQIYGSYKKPNYFYICDIWGTS